MPVHAPRLIAISSVILGSIALVVSGSIMPAQAAPGDDDTPPSRLIDVGSSGISDLTGLVVSPTGELYVNSTAANEINIYAPNATGADLPLAIIGGAHTGITEAFAMVFDTQGYLYVANRNNVLVFAPGATGDALPVRTITGGPGGFADVQGLAIGPDGDLYVTDDTNETITVYSPTADGIDAPLRTISGTLSPGWAPDGIAVDPNGYIFVVDISGTNTIDVFAPAASGIVAPIRSIRGSNTNLNWPFYLALAANGDIFVANNGVDLVTVYSHTADGNTAPIRSIVGADTQVNSPFPIAIALTGEVYVGNWGNLTVGVFASPPFPAGVTSVSPASGAIAGGTAITITGSRFPAGGTASVTVGGVPATDIIVVNSTTITAIVPPHSAGPADVTVSVTGLAPGTLASAFTYVGPALAATGANAAPVAIVGGALLLFGIILLAVRRRRGASTSLSR